MTTLGPRLVVVAVLALFLSFSASSAAQTSFRSQGTKNIGTVSLTAPLAQYFSLALGSWPPWDDWGWGPPKPPQPKKPPVAVPDGGSSEMYLSFLGLACLVAIFWRQRQTSH